jgi:N-acetylmuramoyl-L-alanine amidase
MGAIWLRELPDWLSDAGLNVRTWDGWETRARSSGGYDAIYGIVVHHTASNTTPDNDCHWEWNASDDRPIGAMLLDRTGRVTVGAAGATNCAGKGGPWETSAGTVPLDKGNAFTVSIEAANGGTGEAWPPAQTSAYLVLVDTLCRYLELDPLRDVAAHFEWAPTRKIDPAGPSPWAAGAASWDMDAFRGDVCNGADLTPDEEDEMTDDDVARIAKAVWAYRINDTEHGPSPTGSVLGWTRADAAGAYSEAHRAAEQTEK